MARINDVDMSCLDELNHIPFITGKQILLFLTRAGQIHINCSTRYSLRPLSWAHLKIDFICAKTPVPQANKAIKTRTKRLKVFTSD